MDTIFALASAPGRAGVSVIRVSGPSAFAICAKIAPLPDVGAFKLSILRDQAGKVIDRGLILAFGEGHSFTGDATIEFQVHGSISVVRRLSATLRECGARDAQAGEFTRRALENGMMDLLEVEALADLIDAETEAQHRQAIDGISGRFRDVAEAWRGKLLRAMALTEATIDFADEEVPTNVWPEVEQLCEDVLVDVERVLSQLQSAQIIRSGYSVAIVGKPNTGKSTLLNAIAGEEVAITSERAGTTRDLVSARVVLAGIPVLFFDTAGLREAEDEIELQGISKGTAKAIGCDLRIFLGEGADELDVGFMANDIAIYSKSDIEAVGSHAVSGLTGAGVSELLQLVSDRLANSVQSDGFPLTDRQASGLEQASSALRSALVGLGGDDGLSELLAADLYQAQSALGFVLGKVDVESILGEIFGSFCIGK